MRTLVLLLLMASVGSAEEIPLKSIWAKDMPGTKSLYELEPDIYARSRDPIPAERRQPMEASLIAQIARANRFLLANNGGATEGFAVPGTGIDALRAAHQVRVERQKPIKSFSPETNISLFYFSLQAAQYIHVYRIERKGTSIDIHYRKVPHDHRTLSGNVALIPLGKLPAGKYDVNLVPEPFEVTQHESLTLDRLQQIVCKPFSFEVQDK